MQLWVTPDGHWSRVTKSRVTSDHLEWPQLHYLVIKPRWTASLWEAFYFTPLRRSRHRQWTLFNDALHISREWRQLRTAFSNWIIDWHNFTKLRFSMKGNLFENSSVSETQRFLKNLTNFAILQNFKGFFRKLKDFWKHKKLKWGVKRLWVNAVTPVK